jgi:8-oxo-dGTP pyrophosphatase MutT (NUDIX family)
MRKSEAALAVIRRARDSGSRWLALWNAKWDAFHFVGGHRHPGETFRECMVREISEELGLRDGTDCRVEPAPLAHLDYTAWSNHARVDTEYAMELFAVELFEHAERSLDSNPSVRWLTDDEIRLERCQDGRPVSPTMGFLLARAELL